MNMLKNIALIACMAVIMLYLSVFILLIFDHMLPRSIYMEFGLLSLILGLMCSLLASILSSIAFIIKSHVLHLLTLVISIPLGVLSWLLSLSIWAFVATLLVTIFSAFLTFYLHVSLSKLQRYFIPSRPNDASP